eukprot:Nitzschia sp. Nitz4//scaffold191_size41780//16067//17479//NITZ4_007466-RA/size41780-processed-gene-0.70-mRNA-1//1//CDS//3329540178//3215//frame0
MAAWAGIEFVPQRVMDINVDQQMVIVQDDCSSDKENPTTSIPYDLVSIDIGSTSRGLQTIPGAKEFTIPTRPIAKLVERLEAITKHLRSSADIQGNMSEANDSPLELVVVGGGMAGIELAMSLWGRWNPLLHETKPIALRPLHITILNAMAEILPSETPENRRAMVEALTERGIRIRHQCEVVRVSENAIHLKNTDTPVPFSYCVWASGAGPHDLSVRLAERGVAVSTAKNRDQVRCESVAKAGWIQVNEYLQSISHPNVFAAGDCCTIVDMSNGRKTPPKAGVYAVRAGPILLQNLTISLDYLSSGGKVADLPRNLLVPFIPQEDFLKLVICGDGTAIGFRFGIPLKGKWVFELKDTIDRGFMALFQMDHLKSLEPSLGTSSSTCFKVKQYDDVSQQARPDPLPPLEAAALLDRTDDLMNFQVAWDVIRDMNIDIPYRQQVLTEYHNLRKKQMYESTNGFTCPPQVWNE